MIRRYMRMDEIATEFGVSIDYVREIRRVIRKSIKAGKRYGKTDIVGSDKPVSIRVAAYMDASKYKPYIGTNMEDCLPPYNPIEIEYELRLIDRDPIVNLDEIVDAVIQKLTAKLSTT